MTRVLVVWEDEYWKPLDSVVRRALDLDPRAADESVPSVLGASSRGNGKFRHFIEHTWSNVRPAGTPSNRGRIDHVVCVIDGDKLHDIVASVPSVASIAPITSIADDVAKVRAWQATASLEWNKQLRAWVPPSDDPSTVHGVVLCWSKESLLLAGYDRAPFERVWPILNHTEAHKEFIQRCVPRPDTLAADEFSARYRKPRKCLDLLLAVRASSFPPKSDPRIDDALKALARDEARTLHDRVDSLRTLTELLWRLHRGEPEPAPPPPAPTKPRPRAR